MKPVRNLATIVSFLLVFLTCLYALEGIMPRALMSNSVPKTEFSLVRALDHLKIIAKEPHYVGSPYHKNVREYLLSEFEKLGMEVQIQEETVIGKKRRVATHVSNVLARIRGKGNGKALLLLSHYDSEAPASKGASDAGSGVVTLLEGLRAYLARGEQPLNDIIVLISDAEELGLLGAQAFVDKHPWSKEVGLVLNFEARGSGGPGIMFVETNRGNEGLIRAFDKAGVRHTLSNSLFYSIYKMMPNDTDLTVFRQDGNTQGYNIAFIGDHFDYHTSQDNFDRLDRNTLQHLASYLMPSMEYFANADLSEMTSEADLVFFNFPAAGLIHYPFSWVIPMSVIALLLLFGLVAAGAKKGSLSLGEIGKGFIPLSLSLAGIGLASHYGWQLLLKVHPEYQEMWHGFTYNGHLYVTAFVFLGLWFALRMYQPYLKEKKVCNLYVPVVFAWLLISFGAGRYLPGAGFVVLSVFAGILLLAIFLFAGSGQRQTILSTLITLPILVIFVPMVSLFPIALGLKMIMTGTLLAALLLLLLLPVLSTYKNLKSLNKFFLIIAALTFASASYSSGFSAESKRPDSILYVRKEQNKSAFWVSRDNRTDDFTKQFLGEDPVLGDIPDARFMDAGIGGCTFHREAEPITLTPTAVTVLRDSMAGNRRHIDLRLVPSRKINHVDLRLQEPTEVYSLEVMGETAVKKKNAPLLIDREGGRHLFRYYFTEAASVLEFSYSVPQDDDPSLFLIEVAPDLQGNDEIRRIVPGLLPRPDHIMEKPFVSNGAILNLAEINM